MPEMILEERDVTQPRDGGQSLFWDDWRHRFVGLEGGLGAGKTYIGSRKLVTLHLWNSFDAKSRPTMVKSAVVAPTFDNLMEFDLPAIQDACEDFGLPCIWRHTRKQIEFPGMPLAPIMFRSADKPSRIAGWEVGAFWGDEAARWKEDRDQPMNDPLTQIQGRLRHPKARMQQGIFTYSNEGDHTAIYDFFHSKNPDATLYRASTYDNAEAVGEFIKSQERNLTPELAKQYLDGMAISLSGSKAYAAFSEALHVSDEAKLDPLLPLGLFMDFNIDPGMHGGFCQHFPSVDTLTATHDFHEPSMTVVGMVNAMAEVVRDEVGGWDAFPGIHIYGDPAGHSRGAGTGQSDYTVLMQALQASGCPMDLVRQMTRRRHCPIVDRINAVNVALVDMRGDTHTVINPRCKNLIEDLNKVKRSKDGKSLDKSSKSLTHISDGWGYFVEYERPVRMERTSESRGRIVLGSNR